MHTDRQKKRGARKCRSLWERTKEIGGIHASMHARGSTTTPRRTMHRIHPRIHARIHARAGSTTNQCDTSNGGVRRGGDLRWHAHTFSSAAPPSANYPLQSVTAQVNAISTPKSSDQVSWVSFLMQAKGPIKGYRAFSDATKIPQSWTKSEKKLISNALF